jgi:ribonuclease VapC
VSEQAYVLDASVVLAALLDEPQAQQAHRFFLPDSVIGAVNLSEVVAKLQERGMADESIDRALGYLDLAVIPFDTAQAMVAGKLRARTRGLGLSFGDRACLALAMARGAPAATMDRAWSALDIGAEVIVARD